jgi:hypothetical protein
MDVASLDVVRSAHEATSYLPGSRSTPEASRGITGYTARIPAEEVVVMDAATQRDALTDAGEAPLS